MLNNSLRWIARINTYWHVFDIANYLSGRKAKFSITPNFPTRRSPASKTIRNMRKFKLKNFKLNEAFLFIHFCSFASSTRAHNKSQKQHKRQENPPVFNGKIVPTLQPDYRRSQSARERERKSGKVQNNALNYNWNTKKKNNFPVREQNII